MCISGLEPPSVILSQTKHFTSLKGDTRKLPKQVHAKRDCFIHPQNCNFNQ